MRAAGLLYHDVVDGDRFEESGVPGAGASKYKLDRAEFEHHMRTLAAALPGRCGSLRAPETLRGATPYLLTFDDGGSSAYTQIAPLLESLGLVGHFFIVTDFMNTKGFVTSAQVRELHARGHVIGTHSCSHPQRMPTLDWAALLGEWQRSAALLSEAVGAPVTVGSIPNGYYSRKVAEAAARAGLTHVCTSEPVENAWTVAGCTFIGRFGVVRGTGADDVVALARGAPLPRLRQWASWNARRVVKSVGGELYLRARSEVLSRGAAWRGRTEGP